MKLSIFLAGSITAEKAAFQRKEWEVQDAYFAGDEVVLSDPRIRKVSNNLKQEKLIFHDILTLKPLKDQTSNGMIVEKNHQFLRMGEMLLVQVHIVPQYVLKVTDLKVVGESNARPTTNGPPPSSLHASLVRVWLLILPISTPKLKPFSPKIFPSHNFSVVITLTSLL